jgi:hypothetical protein
VITTTYQPEPGASVWQEYTNRPSVGLGELARALLTRHSHFHGRAEHFRFFEANGVLEVRGCVPSFYLKQVLQTVLSDLDGVCWIDNQVEVVSPRGLSSVRNVPDGD